MVLQVMPRRPHRANLAPASNEGPLPYAQRTHGHSKETLLSATRYLLFGWTPQAIAEELEVSERTVYRWEANLMRYSSAIRPGDITALGQPHKLRKDDEDALFDTLARDS
jgi:hypothetical protein